MTRNLVLALRYDGTRYHGWQVQKNAVTVQEQFQKAVAAVLGSCPDIKGCSRTDTGVHARMYCVSMPVESEIPCERLTAALNAHLPRDIAVYGCQEAPLDFHARYSCRGKRYVYQIWNGRARNPFYDGYALHVHHPMDDRMLNRAAQDFVGAHDFAAFCSTGSDVEDTVRTVSDCSVRREGDLIRFTVAADGFLYNMVRIMVGTLLRISEGKFAPDCISEILKQKKRGGAGPTAPAHGLFLQEVFYDHIQF
ncbi:MAG: tRNA pseudouridine(38-40) synthase TruA [Clostridiales bacterium]|nr:tRNA pseudouridine(38-40) synthase TruA [Clostridiales bacterium]